MMKSKLKSMLRNLFQANDFTRLLYARVGRTRKQLILFFFGERGYAERIYYEDAGKKIDLDNPQTYDEKLWWLKLNNRDSLTTLCSDKHLVRQYVTEKGLGHTLIPQLGAYERAEDVPLDTFTKEVILKCNHGSGTNLIYTPDKPFNKRAFIREFDRALKQNYYIQSLEWCYKNIKPLIVVEEVLRDAKGNLPLDYKFLCFGGEPKLMYLSFGTMDETGRHADKADRYLNTYDMDFNLTEIDEGFPIYHGKVEKPQTFETMKEYARILSKSFCYARVDFYDVDDKVYFGEITIYDGGGNNDIKPEWWAKKMGDWIDLDSPLIVRGKS